MSCHVTLGLKMLSKNVSKYLQTNKPTDKFTKDVVWTKQGATDRIEKYQ